MTAEDQDAERALGLDFLRSANTLEGGTDHTTFLAKRRQQHSFSVDEIPLQELEAWQLGDALRHDTGRYFSVEGVSVVTNFGPTATWDQPIIIQPEVGLLGFLVQRVDGVLRFLVQAKMEPGNREMVQFSPTVQATPSNYTQVHGGRATPYLDHFLEPARGRVLVDQLQSEQGSRYLRKRNRNMVVELPEEATLAIGDDFLWLTLGELRQSLAVGNQVNMNARTVLSCISYCGDPEPRDAETEFRTALLGSHLAPSSDVELREALGWLADRKTEMHLDVRRVPLGALREWDVDGPAIRHRSGRFFRVLGAEVAASSRENQRWHQPLIEPSHPGTIAFLCQRRGGALMVLVQARVEPGFLDSVELGATLQFSPGDSLGETDVPPFADLLGCDESWLRFRALQSEDGGRFYRDEKEHLIIEAPPDEVVTPPNNYRWMTVALLKRLMRCGYHVSIEARSLLACMS